MGGVGDAYDNAPCESFFATLECELLDRHRFRTQAHGGCSTLTPDSKSVASARCRQTPRNRWPTHARPVKEGKKHHEKRTLPRTQQGTLVPKPDSGEALGWLPRSLAE